MEEISEIPPTSQHNGEYTVIKEKIQSFNPPFPPTQDEKKETYNSEQPAAESQPWEKRGLFHRSELTFLDFSAFLENTPPRPCEHEEDLSL